MIKPICGSSNLILNRLQKRHFFLFFFVLSVVNIALAEDVQRSKPAVQKHAEYFDEWQSPSFDCDKAYEDNYYQPPNQLIRQAICESALLSYLDRMTAYSMEKNRELIVNYYGNSLYNPEFINGLQAMLRNLEQENETFRKSMHICDDGNEECLVKAYLYQTPFCKNNLVLDKTEFTRLGSSEIIQFCRRAKDWRQQRYLDYLQTDPSPSGSFLSLLRPYKQPSKSPFDISFTVSQTKPWRKDWYNQKYDNKDLLTGFNHTDPIKSMWNESSGVLGLLNNYSNREELICGLPRVLATNYPKTTFLPKLEPISRVSEREDIEFSIKNQHYLWNQENFINDKMPSGKFKVVDRYLALETGDPTPYWASLISHYGESCFPLPNDPAERTSYVQQYARAHPYSDLYEDGVEWGYGLYGFDYSDNSFPLISSKLEYERVLGNKPAQYFSRQLVQMNPGKTYLPTPYQIHFGNFSLGDGNIFYSTGEDSPEGWIIYDGTRLGSTWSNRYRSPYHWDHRDRPPKIGTLKDLFFSRLWMGTRPRVFSWNSSHDANDVDATEQKKFMIAQSLWGYVINVLPDDEAYQTLDQSPYHSF